MAVVVVSEVLCFVTKNFKRLNKSSLTDIIAKFDHEDKLFAGKVELNKITDDSVPPMVEAWSKLINKQGHPIARKAGDDEVLKLTISYSWSVYWMCTKSLCRNL